MHTHTHPPTGSGEISSTSKEKHEWKHSVHTGSKEQLCSARYSRCIVLKARPTCQVQSERDEAMIASQELQRLLSLHQSPKVICYSFTIEKVVDANQEVPGGQNKG